MSNIMSDQLFNLPFETLFFYLLGSLGVIFAFLTVTAKKLIHSAVYLILIMILFAGYYLLLGLEFMAGIQILLYAGGILILVVFAIMVSSNEELAHSEATTLKKFTAAVTSVLFFGASVYVFTDEAFNKVTKLPVGDEIAAIGNSFLNYGKDGQIISFELISIILLLTLIGGIVIGRNDDTSANNKESK